MTPFSPRDKPRVGLRIQLYDYAKGKHVEFDRVTEVLQPGLHGWIVKTNSGLFIEVECVNTHADSIAWKERFQPSPEQNAKH